MRNQPLPDIYCASCSASGKELRKLLWGPKEEVVKKAPKQKRGSLGRRAWSLIAYAIIATMTASTATAGGTAIGDQIGGLFGIVNTAVADLLP